jgi:hypothetical protein
MIKTAQSRRSMKAVIGPWNEGSSAETLWLIDLL